MIASVSEEAKTKKQIICDSYLIFELFDSKNFNFIIIFFFLNLK